MFRGQYLELELQMLCSSNCVERETYAVVGKLVVGCVTVLVMPVPSSEFNGRPSAKVLICCPVVFSFHVCS